MESIKKTVERKTRRIEPNETVRSRSISYPDLDRVTKMRIRDAYTAWLRNNTRATTILRYIVKSSDEMDKAALMKKVSYVLAEDNQVREFKAFIQQNIAGQRAGRESRNDDPFSESDPILNQSIEENVIDAYTAWYRDFKKAKMFLDKALNEFGENDIDLFFRIVSDVLQERQMVDEFKLFIRRNLPSHLSSSIPESQLDHPSLNALIMSMHDRIAAMESKLL
jgi:hypothetical protein